MPFRYFPWGKYLLLDGSRAMTGDLDLGGDYCRLKSYLYGLAIRKVDDSDFQNIYCNRVLTRSMTPLSANIVTATLADVNSTIYWQSYNGVAQVTNIACKGGHALLPNLPVVDPHVVGALWNDGGTVKVSSG